MSEDKENHRKLYKCLIYYEHDKLRAAHIHVQICLLHTYACMWMNKRVLSLLFLNRKERKISSICSILCVRVCMSLSLCLYLCVICNENCFSWHFKQTSLMFHKISIPAAFCYICFNFWDTASLKHGSVRCVYETL